MPDFSSYVVPGVYVTDVTQQIITATGAPTPVVTLVGPALGFQTYTEQVQVFWNQPTRLTQRGIFTTAVTGPPAIIAPVVKDGNGVVMTPGVDYAFVVDTSQGGGAANAITTIKRLGNVLPSDASPDGLVDGDVVSITYNFQNTDYYTPLLFTDYQSVANTYGAALVSNTASVNSPLTLAAQLAFGAGASQVQCVALNPSAGDFRTQFNNAYSLISNDPSVTLVVPLFIDGSLQTVSSVIGPADAHTSTAVLGLMQDANAAAVAAATNGMGRMVFSGADTTYDSVTIPFPQLASSLASKRTVLAYPNKMSFFNSVANQNITIGGPYLAAVYAGLLAAKPIDQGLTQVTVSGFAGIPAALQNLQTKSFRDSLSRAGVCVTEKTRSGTLRVRHGVTTNMDALNDREISLVRAADTLFQLVQDGMDNAGLIGKPITTDSLTSVVGAMTGILESARNTNVILDWGNLSATQQALPAGDPTIINVSFVYRPALPMNYIQVTFAVDLTSGALNGTTTTPTVR